MEIKRRVCTSLNIVIERAETKVCKTCPKVPLRCLAKVAPLEIVPFMNIITEPLPQLCKKLHLSDVPRPIYDILLGADAGDNWLFKAALIDSMTKLVEVSDRGSGG